MEVIRGTPLEVNKAQTFKTRLLGLMFKPHLDENQTLLLEPCQSIHTFFMRFAIDLLVLDRDYRIIALVKALEPGKVTPLYKSAYSILECSKGTIDLYGFVIGQVIEIVTQG